MTLPKIHPCLICGDTGWVTTKVGKPETGRGAYIDRVCPVCSVRYAWEEEVERCDQGNDDHWAIWLKCGHGLTTDNPIKVGTVYPCHKCVETRATKANHPPKEAS